MLEGPNSTIVEYPRYSRLILRTKAAPIYVSKIQEPAGPLIQHVYNSAVAPEPGYLSHPLVRIQLLLQLSELISTEI